MVDFKYIIKYCFVIGLIALGYQANATHNRAGEITFKQTGDLTFEVTVTTYTKNSSVPADRDSLDICWGDGSCQKVKRSNGGGNGVNLGNDIKFNEYTASHTYGGRGTYIVSMTDPNRNGGILNVNPPNSDQVPFYLQTKITVLNPIWQGWNNSPIFTVPPIDIGYVNQIYVHNPNAYDIEGDSIAYELITPLMAPGTTVTNYSLPNTIGTQPQFLSLNPITGQLIWDSPQKAGEYNVSILVKEYRGGMLISCMVRDMQITIEDGNNQPPTIDKVLDICVVAGEVIDFDVVADDPDMGQKVELTAAGGPLLTTGFFAPAVFSVSSGYQDPILTGNFVWATECEHIQDQPYQVVFRAVDNYETTTGASTFMVVRIKVVGPPPENVEAIVNNGAVDITWDNPYSCDATNEFYGFSVWRREGSNPFVVDTCETGLAGKGYVKIAGEEDIIAGTDYLYTDTNVERGRFYCYRVVADFAELGPAGFAFNFAESLPSEESCIQMSRDLPLITHVSVETTDATNGEIYVEWSKPKAEDLDTLQNTGPYEYRVMRSTGFAGANLQQVGSFTSTTFFGANDTSFVDTGLNTGGEPYSYRIDFYVNGGTLLGSTVVASSEFLTIASSDKVNVLSWQEDVPWDNSEYVIYRQNSVTSNFDSITITNQTTYSDFDVENGTEYCYKIKAIGSYNIPGVIDPIINYSQESCGIPIDTVPPCPPLLVVSNACNDENTPAGLFENFLSWTDAGACGEDTRSYNIFYATTADDPFTQIATLEIPEMDFLHTLGNTVAGCYYVTALDSLENESTPSNVICVDNCPQYTLPNVFTPNNDGVNELFIPYPYQFVDRINLKIVDRWGDLVFETSDPDINWAGTDLSGKILTGGVYYYTCEVYEIRVDGIVQNPDVLTGYIHLIKE